MPKIKINTYGEGIEIRQLQLDVETYQKWSEIAEKRHRPLAELLIDPFFYFSLKSKHIKALSDIPMILTEGMLGTHKGQIEIWYNRKKVLKLHANDLFGQTVLFPLYQIKQHDFFKVKPLDKGIYIIHKTIGLLSSKFLEVTEHDLNVNDFLFLVSEYESQPVLTDIKYKNLNFAFSKCDTMIIYQTAFEVF